MPSIDTNIILRLLLNDVPKQRVALLEKLRQYDTVAVADLAIVETVFVLEKSLRFSRGDVVAFLSALLTNQHLNFNRTLFEEAMPFYSKHPAVSFNDCCLAVYAKLQNQTPLLTFDKKLARQLPYAEGVEG